MLLWVTLQNDLVITFLLSILSQFGNILAEFLLSIKTFCCSGCFWLNRSTLSRHKIAFSSWGSFRKLELSCKHSHKERKPRFSHQTISHRGDGGSSSLSNATLPFRETQQRSKSPKGHGAIDRRAAALLSKLGSIPPTSNVFSLLSGKRCKEKNITQNVWAGVFLFNGKGKKNILRLTICGQTL